MDDKMRVEMKHVALCSNKSTNCFDIGPLSIREPFTFGCSNSIALYQAQSDVPSAKDYGHHSIFTFNFHSHDVVAVQWMRSYPGDDVDSYKDTTLLTGDDNGNLAISKLVGSTLDSLELVEKSKLHDSSIHCLDGIRLDSQNLTLIASSGADSKLKIWTLFDGLSLEDSGPQVLDFKNQFVLGLKFHLLQPCGVTILACACDDFKIRLYVGKGFNKNDEKNNNFVQSAVLQGHEDWVRSITFTNFKSNSWLFASTSQDCTVRVWKLEQDHTDEEAEGSNFLEVKKQSFSVDRPSQDTLKFSVFIDTVLEGHENWVYSAEWSNSGKDNKKLQLLTASMDKTIIVWEYDDNDKMWVDTVRVGEVGGNTLGFYKAMFHRSSNHNIIAQSYSGALYYWKLDGNGSWQTEVVNSGHMAPVHDIDWESKGNFLVSTSKDQTTRIFSEWKLHSTWHEMARPQIHGFDMQCVAMLNNQHFVSGGDEKVVRVFQAPKNFLENFESLTGRKLSQNVDDAPQGASVPALGLSNKAVFSNEKQEEPVSKNDQYIDNLFQALTLQQPPSETDLLQNTLWPEVSKLYGHVYEIYAVASNRSGTLFASASKSAQAQHASIYVWQTSTWKNVAVLKGHTLTVTQIEFSHDGRFLLSVSRDRKWSLYSIKYEDDEVMFELVAQSEKKACHSRIIWSCSWAPDSQSFITASRDKKVMLWKLDEDDDCFKVSRQSVMDYGVAATAVAFSPQQVSGLSETVKHIFAVGLESGVIQVCAVDGTSLTSILKFNAHMSHSLSVQRLKWRPRNDADDEGSLCLASCGLDNQIKIFRLSFV